MMLLLLLSILLTLPGSCVPKDLNHAFFGGSKYATTVSDVDDFKSPVIADNGQGESNIDVCMQSSCSYLA